MQGAALEIPACVLRAERVLGRTDFQALGLKFYAASVPVGYKTRLTRLLKVYGTGGNPALFDQEKIADALVRTGVISREQAAGRVRETVEAVYRAESRRILATLNRLLGDFDLAEEALHDAFTAAVVRWPRDCVPANPRERDEQDIGDDRLRLIITCCHPALPPEAQVALTLREVCDLTTEETARAFLAAVPTAALRIVRAKAKIRLVFNEGYSTSSGESRTSANLCRRFGRVDAARASYEQALRLARQEPERRFLERRIRELG